MSLLQLYVFEPVWFYLPVLAGNVGVYLVFTCFARDLPIDFGISVAGKRLIGPNRTYGGLLSWILISMCVSSMEGRPLIDGLYLGLGGILGTIFNSSVKRRIGLEGGADFIPLDQTDFILGASFIYWLAKPLDIRILICGLLICGIVHTFANLVLKPIWRNIYKSGTR